MTYRPDIDGLRAVAVIAVILFHLNSAWLPGGFLGVDIFFVISGYLIGGILYRELSEGTFSLKRFYLRRMRRILPAFFSVLFFCLVVAYFIMVPGSTDINNFRRSALSSILFINNLYSSFITDYFAPNTELQPLNHLWSLAVEEQFYLLYPIVLILLTWFSIKIAQQFSWKHKHVLITFLVLLVIFCCSMAFFTVRFKGIPASPYYLPHIRFGELLVGAILAIGLYRRNETDEKNVSAYPTMVTRFIGWSSVIILAICLFYPNPPHSPWFPGFAAIIPCIATAGIIHSGQYSQGKLQGVLSTRFSVYLGKRSYSLYLWHWPILAFARYFTESPLSSVSLGILLILIVVLAFAAYQWIEQPLRYYNWNFKKTLIAYYLIPSCIVACFWYIRPNEEKLLPYTTCGIPAYQTEDNYYHMIVGDTTRAPKVLVAGDSYTKQITAFVDKIGKKEKLSAVISAQSGNPFLLDYVIPYIRENKGLGLEKAQARNTLLMSELPQYEDVILSCDWTNYLHYSDYQSHLETALHQLLASKHRVTMIVSCPKVSITRLPETYIKLLGVSYPLAPSVSDIRGDVYYKNQKSLIKLITSIKKKYPQVRIIDITQYIPSDLLVDGKTVLMSVNHLNYHGANYLADRFIASGQRFIQPQDTTSAR